MTVAADPSPLAALPLRDVICGTIIAAIVLAAGAARADEPGMFSEPDEPGMLLGLQAVPSGSSLPQFRCELGFGLSSLLVDPDVEEGYGGGIYFAWGMHQRFGLELTAFFANHYYTGLLGESGLAFIGGNISAGPVLQLTPPGSRVGISAELALGAYLVVPAVQESSWTLGISGGLTFALRVTRWFGIGFKVRYHLYNLAAIAGPQLIDVKAFRTIGVIDRLEVPGYVAFYF